MYNKHKNIKKLNFYLTEELLKETDEMCRDLDLSYSEALRKGLKILIKDWKVNKDDIK